MGKATGLTIIKYEEEIGPIIIKYGKEIHVGPTTCKVQGRDRANYM